MNKKTYKNRIGDEICFNEWLQDRVIDYRYMAIANKRNGDVGFDEKTRLNNWKKTKLLIMRVLEG